MQSLLELLHVSDRVCLVSDEACHKLGHTERLLRILAEAKSEYILTNLSAIPSLEAVEKTASFLRSFRPSFIVVLGGGSVIDVVKTSWALYDNPSLTLDDSTTFNLWDELPSQKKTCLIAVPTTSGSGSDATSGIVLRRKDGTKFYVSARERLPNFSLLDPSLPATLPPEITTITGLGALGNSFEAYMSRLSNDITEALSLNAVRAIFHWLPICYREPENLTAREKMHIAATMTGVAFNNAYSGLAKAIGEAISSLLPVPWGLAIGIALPSAIRFNMRGSEAAESYSHIASALHINQDELVSAVRDLLVAVKAPLGLKALAAEEEFSKNFDALVNITLEHCLLNRTPLTQTDVRELIWEIWRGQSEPGD